MERNSHRKRTTVLSLMKRKAFRMGFEDYRKGVWRADEPVAIDTNGSTWTYERGRLFAAALDANAKAKGLPPIDWAQIKAGNSINRHAKTAFVQLQKARVVL